jgi:hypothetical protein
MNAPKIFTGVENIQTFLRRSGSYKVATELPRRLTSEEKDMKKATLVLLAALFVLAAGAPSFANDPINVRQRRQQERIRRGFRSEELTRREALRLRAEQARIRRFEARARSDGRFSCRERRRANRLLDRANRDIYRQRHDRQDRD